MRRPASREWGAGSGTLRSHATGAAGERTAPRSLLLVAAAVAFAAPASAQDPQNSGALFLEFPVGARAVGMGGAAIADGGSGEAAFWNPAGLADLSASSFELHTAALTAGRSHALMGFFPSARIGVIGAAVYLVDYGDIPLTVDSSSGTVGRISPRNIELLASFATALPGPLTVGVSYKLVTFQVDCAGDCSQFPNGQGVTHAVDVGTQFAIGRDDFTVGVALRNLGFSLQVENKDQADPLPASLTVGALWRTDLGGGDAGRHFDLRVAADIDRPWGRDGDSAVRLGLDVGYRRLARVRAGYGVGRDGTADASVGLGVTSGALGIDLAQTFLGASDLAASNPTYFSFRVSF